ncbi:MAG: membrane protein insertion efficiency factor YidD [Microgenomates group bacterium]
MIKFLVLFLVKTYQLLENFKYLIFKFFLLNDQPFCRFRPTCSEYARQAILKYGIIQGGWLAGKRIIRCHPFNKGGEDPVP